MYCTSSTLYTSDRVLLTSPINCSAKKDIWAIVSFSMAIRWQTALFDFCLSGILRAVIIKDKLYMRESRKRDFMAQKLAFYTVG